MNRENVYSDAFQMLPGASMILRQEAPAFPIVSVNDAYLNLAHLERDAIINQDFFEIFPNELDEVTAKKRNALKEALQRKRPASCLFRRIPAGPVAFPGEAFNYFKLKFSPLLDPAGAVQHILCSLEQKKESEVYEGLIEKTLQVANIGTWQLNLANKKLTCSQSLLDILEVEADFKPDIESILAFFADEKSRAAIKNIFLKEEKKETNFNSPFPVITARGNKKWLLITGGRFHSINGFNVRAYGIAHDITETQSLVEIDNLEKRILELNEKRELPVVEILSEYIRGIQSIYPDLYCSIHKIKDGRLLRWSAPSFPDAYLDAINNIPISANSGSCGTAAFLKKPFYVDDIAHSKEWERYAELPLALGFKACWSYPVIDSGDNVIAVFGMYYKEIRKPGPKELTVIERAVKLLQLILGNVLKTEQLITANQLMEQVQELTRLGTWQWNLDTNQVHWSSVLFDIYGVDPEVHQPSFESYLAALYEEDREPVVRQLEQVQQTGQSAVMEERILRPDGETRYLKTWMQGPSNRKEAPTKMVGACLDITEMKRAEMDLKKMYDRLDVFLRKIVESEKKYSDLFHLSPQPIWVCDPTTNRITNVNAAAIALYGYSREEFTSLTISDIKASQAFVQDDDMVAAFAEGRKKFFSDNVTLHQKKDGGVIYVTVLSKAMELKDKVSEVFIIQDITEKVNYIQAIELQNKKLQEIAWMQSHLVRAPLARIMAVSELIGSPAGCDDDTAELLASINKSAIELDNVLRPIIDKAEQTNLLNL